MQTTRTLLIAGIVLIAVGVAGLLFVGTRAPWVDDDDIWKGPWSGGPMMRGPILGGPGMRGPMMGPRAQGWSPPPINGGRTVEIVATDTSLAPTQIPVKVGEAVNVTLVNRASTVYRLVVPPLGIRLVAPPGQSVTAGFRADVAGEYPFFAGVRGRRGAHVIGRIVVSP
ncbi:MAG: cupredoxin domain-containing protein [Armatimonadota bacterium]|nr:cupredoxin domain-containing protein [Armatimonadota bacterium]